MHAARERIARARGQHQRQQDAAQRVVPAPPQGARSRHAHAQTRCCDCLHPPVPGTSWKPRHLTCQCSHTYTQCYVISAQRLLHTLSSPARAWGKGHQCYVNSAGWLFHTLLEPCQGVKPC